MCLRFERRITHDLEEQLFVESERELARGFPPGRRAPCGSLIVSPASTAVDTVRIAARARMVPVGVATVTPWAASARLSTGEASRSETSRGKLCATSAP